MFAIAMTLLVLDVKIPDLGEHVTEAQLVFALQHDALPAFLAYLLSFYVIGSQWLAHHEMFEDIAYADRRLSLFNMQYLLLIAVMPFPSFLLAKYGDLPLGTAIYAVAVGAGGLGRARMQAYAAKTELLKPNVDRAAWRKDTISAFAFGTLFILSAGLAFIRPWLTYVSWVVVLGGWALLSRSGIFGLIRDRYRRST